VQEGNGDRTSPDSGSRLENASPGQQDGVERNRRRWTLPLVGAISLLSFWAAAALLHSLHEATREEWFRVDTVVMAWVREHTAPQWVPFLCFVTELLAFHSWPVMAALLGLTLYLLCKARRRCEALGILFVVIVAVIGVFAAKVFFRRARPTVPWALAFEQSFSFPSGHAAHAVVLYGLIAYLVARLVRRRAVVILAVLGAAFMALATGYSRVYLGVHYPTDVLAGFVVGTLWLLAGIFLSETLHVFSRPHLEEELASLAASVRSRGLLTASRVRGCLKGWL
jgi:membrane-associated phospholipid phosphatase